MTTLFCPGRVRRRTPAAHAPLTRGMLAAPAIHPGAGRLQGWSPGAGLQGLALLSRSLPQLLPSCCSRPLSPGDPQTSCTHAERLRVPRSSPRRGQPRGRSPRSSPRRLGGRALVPPLPVSEQRGLHLPTTAPLCAGPRPTRRKHASPPLLAPVHNRQSPGTGQRAPRPTGSHVRRDPAAEIMPRSCREPAEGLPRSCRDPAFCAAGCTGHSMYRMRRSECAACSASSSSGPVRSSPVQSSPVQSSPAQPRIRLSLTWLGQLAPP